MVVGENRGSDVNNEAKDLAQTRENEHSRKIKIFERNETKKIRMQENSAKNCLNKLILARTQRPKLLTVVFVKSYKYCFKLTVWFRTDRSRCVIEMNSYAIIIILLLFSCVAFHLLHSVRECFPLNIFFILSDPIRSSLSESWRFAG